MSIVTTTGVNVKVRI